MKKTLIPALVAACCLTGLSTAGTAQETEEEIAVRPGELLEVDLDTGGSIDIQGWDRDSVSVTAHQKGSNSHSTERLQIEKTDSGVRVSSTFGEGLNRRGKYRSRGVDLKIRVPLRFDLQIESMGGEITVDNVDGTIEGETMGGELRLSNLGGEVELSTMGGDIRLVDSEVDGSVETMGGEVLLENVVGEVNGSSMGGHVIYKNVTRPDGASTGEALVVSTMGGDVRASEAWHGAKLHTMGGDIELGAAAGYVDAETMGGDIELGSVDGWVNATTMGGDVEVKIVGDPQADDHDVTLESMGGEIRLTVPRNFSAEVEIELAYTKGRKEKYRIDTDLELAVSESENWLHDRGTPRKIITGTGTFNGGRNKIKISTINGNVILKQGL